MQDGFLPQRYRLEHGGHHRILRHRQLPGHCERGQDRRPHPDQETRHLIHDVDVNDTAPASCRLDKKANRVVGDVPLTHFGIAARAIAEG